MKTRIVQPPQDVSVIKGSTTVLKCGVSHDPTIQVTWVWHHGNNVVLSSDPRRQLLEDGSLRISQVRNEDIGTYRCQVTSLGGNDAAEAIVKVIGEIHHRRERFCVLTLGFAAGFKPLSTDAYHLGCMLYRVAVRTQHNRGNTEHAVRPSRRCNLDPRV